MNNRQTPDTSAGAFLTAVLEVQNKQWTTAKGELHSQVSMETAAKTHSEILLGLTYGILLIRLDKARKPSHVECFTVSEM